MPCSQKSTAASKPARGASTRTGQRSSHTVRSHRVQAVPLSGLLAQVRRDYVFPQELDNSKAGQGSLGIDTKWTGATADALGLRAPLQP